MQTINIAVADQTLLWINRRMDGSGFKSLADYISHLVEEDRVNQSQNQNYFASIMARNGVNSFDELVELANRQAKALENHEGEREDQEFIDSLQLPA